MSTTEQSTAARPPKGPPEQARAFAVDAARVAADTRCKDVVVLDVRGISPITDFFVLATGSSGRQMRAVAEEVEEMGKPRGFVPFGRNGYEGESWLLADFVDVILHVFSPTARGYYDLEGLWGDAPRVDWETGRPPPKNAAAEPPDDEEDVEESAAAYERYAVVDDEEEDEESDNDDEA